MPRRRPARQPEWLQRCARRPALQRISHERHENTKHTKHTKPKNQKDFRVFRDFVSFAAAATSQRMRGR
jgi:hypothetical protein